MDNPETLVALSTQDTGQINVKKNRGDLSILDGPLGFL
jgi:hypothetical protein